MATVRWLSEAEERAWRRYRRMRTLLDLQISRDLGRDSGLSDPDYDVLSTLTEAPEPSWRASTLAERLLWSTSRLAHHVGRMERRGLVTRGGCSGDARGATVTLTPAGRKALEDAAPAQVASVRRHLIDLLSPAEVDVLATIAGKVIEHLAGPDAAETADHRPGPDAAETADHLAGPDAAEMADHCPGPDTAQAAGHRRGPDS